MYSYDISQAVPLNLEDYENGYACDSLQAPTQGLFFVPKFCQLTM